MAKCKALTESAVKGLKTTTVIIGKSVINRESCDPINFNFSVAKRIGLLTNYSKVFISLTTL